MYLCLYFVFFLLRWHNELFVKMLFVLGRWRKRKEDLWLTFLWFRWSMYFLNAAFVSGQWFLAPTNQPTNQPVKHIHHYYYYYDCYRICFYSFSSLAYFVENRVNSEPNLCPVNINVSTIRVHLSLLFPFF